MYKDNFCKYCGNFLASGKLEYNQYPIYCDSCKSEIFANPIPAINIIAPTKNGGVILVLRNIEPLKGKWALPGGYINAGEGWFSAALREFEEETGLYPANMHLFDKISLDMNDKQDILIIFVTLAKPYFNPYELKDFKPNEEASKIKIVYKPIELAFPSHTKALQEHFLSKVF